MAITEVDQDHAATARQLRDEVARGLQEPMGEVVRTLQQLAIAQVSPESPQLDPQLLVRARSLAHGLSQVIDQIVSNGTQQGVLDSREPQETILVRSAFETAASCLVGPASERPIVVRGASRVALTTNPAKFHSLIMSVLETIESDGEVRVVVERSRGELLLQFEHCEISSANLDTVRGLARAIGGTADRTTTPHDSRLVVWLPQQRCSDPIER